MFSGIIEGVGNVAEAVAGDGGVRLTVRVPKALQGLAPGSSVSVNGTCLTVVTALEDGLVFDAVGATLDRTLLGSVTAGDGVNLERSLRVGGSLDGHFVTGHVDGVGTVCSQRREAGAIHFSIDAPEELVHQIVPRGSIAVDGVSLTVAEVQGTVFTVSIVPYTLRETIFGRYREGSRVHLETDILAKYVEGTLRSEGQAGPRFADTEKAQ